MVEDAVSAPGAGAMETIDACSGEPEASFRAADTAFATRSPSDYLSS